MGDIVHRFFNRNQRMIHIFLMFLAAYNPVIFWSIMFLMVIMLIIVAGVAYLVIHFSERG